MDDPRERRIFDETQNKNKNPKLAAQPRPHGRADAGTAPGDLVPCAGRRGRHQLDPHHPVHADGSQQGLERHGRHQRHGYAGQRQEADRHGGERERVEAQGRRKHRRLLSRHRRGRRTGHRVGLHRGRACRREWHEQVHGRGRGGIHQQARGRLHRHRDLYGKCGGC